MEWIVLIIFMGWLGSIFSRSGSRGGEDSRSRSAEEKSTLDQEKCNVRSVQSEFLEKLSIQAETHKERETQKQHILELERKLGLAKKITKSKERESLGQNSQPQDGGASVRRKAPRDFEFSVVEDKKEKCVVLNGTPPAVDIVAALRERGVGSLWHMTHYQNVNSIMQSGLLSHTAVVALGTIYKDVSDPDVQRHRAAVDPFYHRKIHDYVPLYINPRNPMLSRLRARQKEFCFIEVCTSVLNDMEFLLADGNAAAARTRFFRSVSDISQLPWDVLHANYWTGFPDGKRQRCAEVLVYPRVYPRHFKSLRLSPDLPRPSVGLKNISILEADEFYFR